MVIIPPESSSFYEIFKEKPIMGQSLDNSIKKSDKINY